jgi:hypothetical protein
MKYTAGAECQLEEIKETSKFNFKKNSVGSLNPTKDRNPQKPPPVPGRAGGN